MFPQSLLEESHAQDRFRGLGDQKQRFLEGHGIRFARVWGPKDTNLLLATGGSLSGIDLTASSLGLANNEEDEHMSAELLKNYLSRAQDFPMYAQSTY